MFIFLYLCLFYVILHSFTYLFICVTAYFLASADSLTFSYIPFIEGPGQIWGPPSFLFSGFGVHSWGQDDRSLQLTT